MLFLLFSIIRLFCRLCFLFAFSLSRFFTRYIDDSIARPVCTLWVLMYTFGSFSTRCIDDDVDDDDDDDDVHARSFFSPLILT